MFDLNADNFQPERFANIDGRTPVADVEGLALSPIGDNGGYLVAISQGDNSYVLYDHSTGNFACCFRLVDVDVDGTR